ncbi:hypothetical protein GCM10009759_55040 [Kitasatospora saccharophila]|uniref:Uncharacterized protein n=1 Tax=Kitasatospora saccharophila TaxID=407973 RepID=A0ABN2XK92_9ACTN
MPESAQTWALTPAALASRAWIDATADGLVAFLLLAPSSTAIGLEDMAGLAAAIGLAGPQESMPAVGERVTVAGARAVLQVPEIGRAFRIVATEEWRLLVRRGGTIVILLSADPLPEGAAKADVDTHLRAGTAAGRLWLGKALRSGGTGTWVACGECSRCVSGTGRNRDPEAADCYAEWLDASVAAAALEARRSA